MKRTRQCPSCGGREIYATEVHSGGGYSPDLLPGAHPWWGGGRLEIYVCGTCGHFQYFVPENALAKVRESKKFRRYPS
jgi:hypothetical protein